jgi:hypothetical protein
MKPFTVQKSGVCFRKYAAQKSHFAYQYETGKNEQNETGQFLVVSLVLVFFHISLELLQLPFYSWFSKLLNRKVE